MADTQSTIYQIKETRTRAKIILFDLDGTLIDSTEAILESFEKTYQAFDKKAPKTKTIKSLIGLPLEIMFEQLGIDKKETMNYADTYKEHYKTIHTQKTKLLPKAKEALVLAQEHARLGVVTTKTSSFSRMILEHFDIMKYFDILIGREDAKRPKPNPEPIEHAMNALGYHFGKITYMIGDTATDMIAAQEANIGSIGVLCGYGSKDDLDKYADFVFKDTYSAVQFIKKI